MDPRNHSALKQAARDDLARCSCDPRKLVLIHSGAAVALSVLVTLINYLLNLKINQASGLSGLDTVANLSAIQSFLSYAGTLIMPFWEAGFLFTTLCIVRQKAVAPASLLEGFHRFGPVLRYTLLMGLLQVGIAMLTFMVSMNLFMLTPLSNGMAELSNSLPQDSILADGAAMITPELQAQAAMAAMPLIILFGAMFIGVLLYVSYHLRLGMLILFDHPGIGALAAMRGSRIQMRGHKKELLKLDLTFWWYYAAQVVITLLANVPYILSIFGQQLSFAAASFLFLGISLVGQLALSYFARYKVDTTYAEFYLATIPKPQEDSQTVQTI